MPAITAPPDRRLADCQEGLHGPGLAVWCENYSRLFQFGPLFSNFACLYGQNRYEAGSSDRKPVSNLYGTSVSDRTAQLTDMQKRCLRLVAANRTSKEIAIEVGLTPMTVDQYLSRATAQLGAANRREAARILLEDDDQSAFRQFEFKPADLAGPQKSPNLELSEASQMASDRQPLHRALGRIGDAIGGPRHDLNSLQVLVAVARTALVTTGALAVIVATGYWLNYLFR